jgi:hypothetical protein
LDCVSFCILGVIAKHKPFVKFVFDDRFLLPHFAVPYVDLQASSEQASPTLPQGSMAPRSSIALRTRTAPDGARA